MTIETTYGNLKRTSKLIKARDAAVDFNAMETASVDETKVVTTGCLWWKRVTQNTIRRSLARRYGSIWFFTETGATAPAVIGNLVDAHDAQCIDGRGSWPNQRNKTNE